MFKQYGKNSKRIHYLVAILFEGWRALQKDDHEENEPLWVDGGFVASYFELSGSIDANWDQFGQRLFGLTYDPEPGALDIIADRHVFTDRTTGYFHRFQGIRPDAGSFTLDSVLVESLKSIPTRARFIEWLVANSQMSAFHVDQLCFEIGQHHMLDHFDWAELLSSSKQ